MNMPVHTSQMYKESFCFVIFILNLRIWNVEDMISTKKEVYLGLCFIKRKKNFIMIWISKVLGLHDDFIQLLVASKFICTWGVYYLQTTSLYSEYSSSA